MPTQQRKSRDDGSFSERADPVLRALRVQRGAAALNFDWPDAGGALAKLREEIEELEALLASSGTDAAQTHRGSGHAGQDAVSSLEAAAAIEDAAQGVIDDEVGDLLFAAVNVARLCGSPPGEALSSATEKFERRFEALLARARARGIEPRKASLEELDALWEDVKSEEGSAKPQP